MREGFMTAIQLYVQGLTMRSEGRVDVWFCYQ